MKIQQLDTDIPANIDRFLSLIKANENLLESDHFLNNYIKKYNSWKVNKDFNNVPQEVLNLASISANVFLFRNDWSNQNIKDWMINKIRNVDQSKGILFEFRSAVHYRMSHKKVNWIANNLGRIEPDIRIETDSGHIVYTECTRKLENNRRVESERVLISDILRTVKKKMRQRQVMTRPLHLTIYIPEVYKWSYDSLNTELGRRIHKRFYLQAYSIITAEIGRASCRERV